MKEEGGRQKEEKAENLKQNDLRERTKHFALRMIRMFLLCPNQPRLRFLVSRFSGRQHRARPPLRQPQRRKILRFYFFWSRPWSQRLDNPGTIC